MIFKYKKFLVRLRKRAKFLGILLAVIISISVFANRQELLKFQELGYVGLFFLNLFGAATVFLPTPLFISAMVAGTFMNPVIVAFVASVGSTLGETTGYMAGMSGRGVLKETDKLTRTFRWMNTYGVWGLVVLAAIPNPAFDITGIIAGATRIPITKYFAAIWVGKFIKFLFLVYAGHIFFHY